MDPRLLLEFWLSDYARPLWFEKNAAFDAEIRHRFSGWIEPAAQGRFADWERRPDTALALVVLLDQFPRNIHRESPRAYLHDAVTLAIAMRAIARGHDQALPLDQRFFFYMPLEHSESLADQCRAMDLFRGWVEAHEGDPRRGKAEEAFRYVARHHEIIERFGRFPHRNRCLGRNSTPEELAFLTEPMSSF
ncbi:MAG TPA: DUF924 family protein [Hypericibacter adhaerens]|jgi:uncharacterized protein (DUF924 family)|uniref:Membrane protein n=1 Tax=Hypericibacter adhaerens TaxID=2602016 RepID=A0A5J6N8F6_9PROT|nr:DUF924 family protein [Hypericibacter adhaerens]QEX25260.1 membrane protein [Hypericibacter adhaerens]HWA44305.1 DUF924 family protein [Hypericibacter adhaerens]